jgi:4'-phosphopantetheinyl transferase
MTDAELHLIHPGHWTEGMGSDLSADEHARASRFVFEDDARRWSIYRNGLRRILGRKLGIEPRKVPLIAGPNGKPALATPFSHLEFNLSHCDELAVVVLSESGTVGIDLEPWSRASSLIECAEIFCHPDELKELPSNEDARATRLLEIWTSKEAFLKALGTGLSYPPQQVRIIGKHATADTSLQGLSDLHLMTPFHPRLKHHRLAVAVNSEVTALHWELG